MSVIEEIAAERKRQVEAEGFDATHDDQHSNGEISDAALCYGNEVRWRRMFGKTVEKSLIQGPPAAWPWAREWWKPKNDRRDLIRAAALIVAEIERLDRL